MILVPLDNIDSQISLHGLGVDSMFAAEFRSRIWAAFKVDIPFVDILGQHNSLSTLSEIISAKLAQRNARVDTVY